MNMTAERIAACRRCISDLDGLLGPGSAMALALSDMLADLEAALVAVEAAQQTARRLCDGTWKSTDTCDGCLQQGVCEAQSLYAALAALGEEGK